MRITDVLRASDLFEHLSSDDLQQLAAALRERHVRRDEVLCHQGDPAEEMFFIIDGCIQLTSMRPDGRLRMIRQLADGDSFGDIALFSDDRHAATAGAISESRVAVLRKDAFEALVATRPHIMRTVLAAVSRRAGRALRQVAAEQPGDALVGTHSQVYAIFSPRGGAGKTTLAINLAARLAGLLPDRVALLDLDLVFDDAALLLNLDQPPALASIPEGDLQRFDLRSLANYLVEHDSGVRVVVGAARPEDGERISAAHVRAVLAAMRRRFLATVVDCGSGVGKPTLAALEAAERVIVVCTPELTTLRDVRDSQRILGQALHASKNKVVYVLNHPIPSAGLSRAKLETALEQPIAIEIPYAGESAARAGLSIGTLVRAHGRSPYARAIDHLVALLNPPAADVRAGQVGSGAETSPAPPVAQRLLRLLRGDGIRSALLTRHGG